MTYDKWLHLTDDLRYLQAAIKDVRRNEYMPDDIALSIQNASDHIREAQVMLMRDYAWTDEIKSEA